MNSGSGLRRVSPVAHDALTPVFVGLRTGLHLLVGALLALVVGRTVLAPTSSRGVIVVLAVVFLATYAAGALLTRGPDDRPSLIRIGWLCLVSLEWFALLWLTPEAAYLVFPLFFLYLHLLGPRAGTIIVAVTVAVAIIALGIHSGWSVGGVIGPLVGAGVAVMIGLGYRALAREAAQRERLMAELLATRDQLVASEHESGVLAERSRLAREIHDTLAQGLSSIQMLLHAAERADPDRPGIEHLRLARETAATNLADARRFIRELTPPNLDEAGLGGTLCRLAETQWGPHGLAVDVRVAAVPSLPMHLQTALLRIAQGAVANVIQHADATTVTITLTTSPLTSSTLTNGHDALHFTIADDGRGFDPAATASLRAGGVRTDSFGLRATKERVEQLGGVLRVESSPEQGTVIAVELLLKEPS